MPIYQDKARGRLMFEFDRSLGGPRVRTRKLLPRAWTRAQADAFDRKECARLYGIATGTDAPIFTIDDAVGRYLKDRIPQLKHGRGIAAELALIAWAYAGQPLGKLDDVCRRYADHERGNLAPATIKNRIRYLVAACRYGWKHGGMGEHDPAARVVTPKVSNARHEYVDRATMLLIAQACKHRETRAAIRIAFYSGMRLSEIEAAERDLVRQAFVLTDTKNGEPRIVPMHPRLRALAHYQMPTRYILSYWWRRARDAVAMDHLHFHDLRHSAASAMVAQGIDLYTVGAVLGHKSMASTKRYSHLAADRLAAAVGAIGQKSPPPPDKKKAA